jgi:hypothetical protein
MPIMFKPSFLGRRFIGMPPLTRTLGPIFTRVSSGPELSDHVRFQLLVELIAKLPDVISFHQNFEPQCDNLLAFHVGGFSIDVYYTYRLENCFDTATIWKGMRDKTRNEIRRSQDHLQIYHSVDVVEFVEFYEANLRRCGKSIAPERNRIKQILEAAITNNAGTSILCRTEGGDLVAAIFLVWDDQYCYYLLSTRDERVAGNGSVSLLLWEALQLAGQVNRGFDFDGFHSYGTTKFVRQFGARVVPRWSVWRRSWLVRAALLLRPVRLYCP